MHYAAICFSFQQLTNRPMPGMLTFQTLPQFRRQLLRRARPPWPSRQTPLQTKPLPVQVWSHVPALYSNKQFHPYFFFSGVKKNTFNLKRQCHEIFELNFFHPTILIWFLINGLNQFSLWLQIRCDILSTGQLKGVRGIGTGFQVLLFPIPVSSIS
jgi:hypothetical protein